MIKSAFIEEIHGVKISDPYRWMETPQTPKIIKWVEEQNKLTRNYIDSNDDILNIKERIKNLWNYPKYSVPVKKGEHYFYLKNEGLQNQPVIYRQKGLNGEPQVIIDSNKLSDDGTVSITHISYSNDGKLMAYALSQHGSDWQEIKIRDIDKDKDYEEVLKWVRFGSVSWKDDKSGFYYNRYPEAGTVPPEDQCSYNKLYFHKIGTPQSEDILIYERPDAKELSFYPDITDDNKYLVITVQHACVNKNRIYYRELESNGDFIRLIDIPDGLYGFIENFGTTFYFQTDIDAPRGKIIAIDINNPGKENWKDVIPEQEYTIDNVTVINNQFVIAYIHNAHYRLMIYNIDGTFDREIYLPAIGTIFVETKNSISGKKSDTDMFFAFTSFLFPAHVFHYNFKTGKLSQLWDTKIDFDTSLYETKQIFYTSKDGTKVPMFLTHKKGISLNGNNPVMLYGYGGFSISLTPSFSVSRLVFLEHGGIFALANLRGGGEYGDEWHKAGMLEKKQNVFDDFIGAAEWLIENKYTNPSKLSIAGGSNGGLLVSACMVQRPDLFGAVICSVPLTDMLRYHKFTVGHRWIPEYGDPDNPEHFKFIYEYSPFHNIKEGEKYPPILVITADTDDRVVPYHAQKFVAKLQKETDKGNMVFLRMETKAGHGQGKPTSKIIDEHADMWTFLFKVLKVNGKSL